MGHRTASASEWDKLHSDVSRLGIGAATISDLKESNFSYPAR